MTFFRLNRNRCQAHDSISRLQCPNHLSPKLSQTITQINFLQKLNLIFPQSRNNRLQLKRTWLFIPNSPNAFFIERILFLSLRISTPGSKRNSSVSMSSSAIWLTKRMTSSMNTKKLSNKERLTKNFKRIYRSSMKAISTCCRGIIV